MFFILRAIFWLAVVSAIMPMRASQTTAPLFAVKADDVAKAAVDYCHNAAIPCAQQAWMAASTLRIPASVFAAAVAQAGSQTPATIPMPTARPTL